MNLTVWLIDKSIKPHRFGVVKAKAERRRKPRQSPKKEALKK